MMTTTVAESGDSEDDFLKVPGDDVYYINFEVDWSVFDSGMYSYGPEGSTVRRIGGGRGEYDVFFDLTLDFSFKDGRRYLEVIDVNVLMKELVSNEEIFDLRNTRWGGVAAVVVTIKEDELKLEYMVSERILEPDYELNHHYYPLYKKKLD